MMYKIGQFKSIPGYEGIYSITEDGQVWSHKVNRFLKPSTHDSGYCYVYIQSEDGKTRKHQLLHRLVASAWIGKPPKGKPEVNHKDKNRSNNHYTNLEWVSHSENIQHSFDNGRETSIVSKRKYEDLLVENQELKTKIINLERELKYYQYNRKRKTEIAI